MDAVAIDHRFLRNLKYLKFLTWISAGAAVIGLALMLLGSSALFDITLWAENPNGTRWLAVGIGGLLGFPAHLVMLGTIVLALRSLEQVRFIGTLALILGAISLILLPSDYACLHDIAKEYAIGVNIQTELKWLRLGVIAHYIYLLCQLALCFNLVAILKRDAMRRSTRPGESLFDATNILGIVCAAIGWGLIFYFYQDNLPTQRMEWYVLPIIVVVLTPYLMILASWLYTAWKEKHAGFLDEKQKGDLARAATTAWIVSIPAMIAVFAVNYGNVQGPGSVLWLPAYFFTSLLVFSISSLFYFRRT